MPFQIIRSDITKVTADAIVNTANPHPVVGGGTDAAVYRAAGEEKLLAERQKIGEIAPGEAAVTPAFDLDAKYIIHTVGPAWIDGNHGERNILHSCYERSLNLAAELSCESIAFPLIATGVYGFPKDEALDIALTEIGRFLLTHEMDVTIVVFDRKAFQLSRELMGDIEEYIDDHSVDLLHASEYKITQSYSNLRRLNEEWWDRKKAQHIGDSVDLLSKDAKKQESISLSDFSCELYDAEENILKELLAKNEDTFQQRLFRLIDERGLTDPEVYNKANISRKVFSKIRCNKDYHPKKKTAVAFAIALNLDMPEMRDLLSRAGFAFSPSSKFDLIVSYFVEKKIYDINKINSVLFEYDQELLEY